MAGSWEAISETDVSHLNTWNTQLLHMSPACSINLHVDMIPDMWRNDLVVRERASTSKFVHHSSADSMSSIVLSSVDTRGPPQAPKSALAQSRGALHRQTGVTDENFAQRAVLLAARRRAAAHDPGRSVRAARFGWCSLQSRLMGTQSR